MNKKIMCVLLGISVLAFLSSLYAQQEEYLEDGKVWSVLSVSGPSVEERWTYTVSVFGAEERGGHIWKRSRTDELEFLLLRQEGKKIWAIYPYDDGGMDTVPFLMFDFGLKKGDTAHLYVDTIQHRDDAWIVESVFDSVLETGQEARHCQQVYLMNRPETKDVWVEGIGSLTNGLTYSPVGFLRGPSELICVQKATGDVVYHNKKYPSCYIDDAACMEQPEVPYACVRYDATSQSIIIESDVKPYRLEVFDVQGRCVMKVDGPAGSVSVARLPHGLYLYRLTAAGTTLSGKFVR